MENKKLINEITRIQEMMGVNIITESGLTKFVDKQVARFFDELLPGVEKLAKTGVKELDSEIMQDVATKFNQELESKSGMPYSKKLKSLKINTLEDLVNNAAKFSEKEFKEISSYILTKSLKEIESTGKLSSLIDDNILKGDTLKPIRDILEVPVPDKIEDIEGVKTYLDDLKKVRNDIEVNGYNLSNEGKQKLISDYDAKISEVEGKIQKSGGDVADDAAGKTGKSSEIDVSRLLEIQEPKPEDIAKTFLPHIIEEAQKTKFWKSLNTKRQELFSQELYANLLKYAQENKVISEKVLSNNEKQFDNMVELWNSPAMKPSTRMGMIEKVSKDLDLGWTMKDKEYWGNFLLPFTDPKTGKLINPITKDGFKAYLKKYVLINLGLAGVDVFKNVATTNNVGFDNLPGDTDGEKIMNLWHPVESAWKLVAPGIWGPISVGALDLVSSDNRAPSEKELIDFLKSTVDASDKSTYDIVVDTDNKITLLKDKSGTILGSYSYDNENKKVTVNKGIKPGDNAGSTTITTPEASEDDFKKWYDKLYPSHSFKWADAKITVESDKLTVNVKVGNNQLKFKKQTDGSYSQQ
jgi:hypothetical protein